MNLFTGIFSILISLVCFWMGIKFLRLYLNVKKWGRITAKIISKEVALHEKYSTGRNPYKLSVKYVYNVNGIEYTGHKIYLAELLGGQANHMKSDAENRLARIKDTMIIYVDPNDANRSVMYCTGAGLYYFIILLAAFALIFGITKIA